MNLTDVYAEIQAPFFASNPIYFQRNLRMTLYLSNNNNRLGFFNTTVELFYV